MKLIRIGILILITIISSLIIIFPVSSVVITGSVYGPDFDALNDVVIRINTQPVQQILAKEGTYEFNVPEGIYELNAYYKGSEGEKYFFSEKIDAKGTGQYVLDIIMLPDTETEIVPYPESIFDNEPNLSMKDETENESKIKQTRFTAILILGISIILIVSIILYLLWKKRKAKQHNAKKENTNIDESYEKILEMIKKNKRMTQKDITKEMFLSDAKVSLILTEMESKEIIKKIKKGRTNIIILNK